MGSVLKDSEHALYVEFERLPHGRRFRSLAHKTNRRGMCSTPQHGMISPLIQLYAYVTRCSAREVHAYVTRRKLCERPCWALGGVLYISAVMLASRNAIKTIYKKGGFNAQSTKTVKY